MHAEPTYQPLYQLNQGLDFGAALWGMDGDVTSRNGKCLILMGTDIVTSERKLGCTTLMMI